MKLLPFQDMIRSIYGYALCKQDKYAEALKVLSWLLKPENKQFVTNFTADETDLLSSLCADIGRMNVNQW